jgi:hypothetical protein
LSAAITGRSNCTVGVASCTGAAGAQANWMSKELWRCPPDIRQRLAQVRGDAFADSLDEWGGAAVAAAGGGVAGSVRRLVEVQQHLAGGHRRLE